MVYDPTRPTVRSLVLASVVASLQAMASPAYATRFELVRQWNTSIEDVTQYPSALVLPMEDHHDDGRSAIMQNLLDLAVVVVVRDQNWAELLDRAITEVRVALLADVTRGGIAAKTEILHTLVWDSEGSSPVAAAQVLVRVLYRTLYEDPTTPH